MERTAHPENARESEVLTVKEAAAVLRIQRSAAYAAVARGEIPSFRIGGSIRIPRRALDELLGRASEHAPT